MTVEEIAGMLSEDAPDWVRDELRFYAPLIGYHIKSNDDLVERTLFKSAEYLDRWLQLYVRAYEKIGEEVPECIEQVSNGLEELIPILARGVRLPRKGGPPPDDRRHLCAEVCADIWKRLHGAHQPRSERLWEACEAYWQFCGHPETSAVSRLRNWERYLLELSHP